MKRHGNLFPQVISFDNLLLAAKKAQKGKRFRENVLEFNYHLEHEIFTLQQELEAKTYQPGAYRTFQITDPKSRLISAAPYRDRVIHHALCNIIAPIFERTFIYDSYANRIGLGTHKALERFTKFFCSSRYVLQYDIRKYFPSIDHEILKELIRRKIKCKETLWLIDKIIDNSDEQESITEYFPDDNLTTSTQQRKGLPIGNLTSQFFANVYLNGLDHFIKEDLHITKYVRYMDDFALFSNDDQLLIEARAEIEEYLTQLRLKLHPIKSQLFSTKCSATFLGFRILSDHIRVKNSSLHRGRRRLRKLQSDYSQGKISEEKLT